MKTDIHNKEFAPRLARLEVETKENSQIVYLLS